MRKSVYIKLVLIVAFFAVNAAFSKNQKSDKKISLYKMVSSENKNQPETLCVLRNDDEVSVAKTTKGNLDIYVFKPDNKFDRETMLAVADRLKTLVEGFVSLSISDGNEAELIIDSTIVTQEKLELSLKIVTEVCGYYNYKIEE